MKMNSAIFVAAGFLAFCGCSGKSGGKQEVQEPVPQKLQMDVPVGTKAAAALPDPSDGCRRAGGVAKRILECDGSESLWCAISEREACYADQVVNGRCTAGEYSEELKGIVGITPRVVCDNGQ